MQRVLGTVNLHAHPSVSVGGSFFSGLVRVLFRPGRDVGSVDEDTSDENGWQEG